MKLQNAINSPMGVGLALTLSQLIPVAPGYALARQIADRLSARRQSPIVHAIRANQWVIHAGKVHSAELDILVRDTLRHTGRCLFDFYHNFRNPQKILELVYFDPSFMFWLERARQGKEGLLMVVPHLTNFDLIGRAAALSGLPLHVLSFPQPPGGYRWQNELRSIPNLNITPISPQALRQASESLNNRKVVLTGIDRPIPQSDRKYRPRFFGRPASLPVLHIRLAIKHNLPILVIRGHMQANGQYLIACSEPVVMQHRPDLVEETTLNAEAVLAQAEPAILASPEQWAMFYPVWPEALEEMKKT